MVESSLNLILLLIAVFLLFLGALQDWKAREIVDWVWIVMTVCGCIIHSFQIILLLMNKIDIQNYLFTWLGNIAIALIIALFLTFSGLGGEADRIAFVAIAFISPVLQPLIVITDPKYDIIFSITPKILGTFFNAYLLALVVPVALFWYNLVRRNIDKEFYKISNQSIVTKVVLYFIGYPRSTQHILKDIQIKPWHFDFLETYNEKSGWNFVFQLRLGTPEEDLTRKKEIARYSEIHNKDSIWIQPSLPFIVFILLGFLLEVLIGNILFVLTASLA
ncbi:MAG: A24 family peptidase C-terminal domain-containing protein [Candidatus Hodarchaeales archaeon]|jgi:hypothetical protein